MYFKVYVKKIKGTYTYKYHKDLEVGSFCEIDFRNKLNIGIIISKTEIIEKTSYEIKDIIRELDIPKIPEELLKLSIFINTYYISDFFSSLSLLGPYEKLDKLRMLEYKNDKIEINDNIILTKEQENVFNEIKNSKDSFYLLHGITGSGKTQIYIKLIIDALNEGKSSIFLMPEITLSTQMLKSFEKIFGKNISVIHSKMSENKKIKEWEKIYVGASKIIMGARSAIFSPSPNLKYIIIDEEHENTYKQEDKTRYHIRNIAIKRAMLLGIKVIFASATPSFESYYLAMKNNFRLLSLNNRYNNIKLPSIEIVDLEQEEDMLSKKLLFEIKDRLEKEEQVILFLNRKSYSNLVKCPSCNEKLKCKKCSSYLQYYKSTNILKCSHCEYSEKFKEQCKNCLFERLELLGLGTEKIEEKLIEYFGKDNILRMDSTTMSSNLKIKQAYNDFINKKYSILIGTQIIAKGFHFPNVTLVGIINADQILGFTDFRAGEKTFQLITQAAGRAGRDIKEGKVIVQTYQKDSFLIDSIIKKDYFSYYNYEMNLREILKLPPFSKLVKIIVSSKKEEKALKKAKELKKELMNIFSDVSDFNKANIYKINDWFRYVIYIKTNLEEIKKKRYILKEIKNQSDARIRILIDVDPITMD